MTDALPNSLTAILKDPKGDPSPEKVFREMSRIFPWLHKMENTPQDPEWHAEGNVKTHTLMVMEEVLKLAPDLSNEDQLCLIVGALLHDIGKVVTTRNDLVDGKNRIISPGHTYAGYSHVAKRIFGWNIGPYWISKILGLIRYHHHPKRLVFEDPPQIKDAHFLNRIASNRLLYLLEGCDIRGRICEDQGWLLEQMELYKHHCEDWGLFQKNNLWLSSAYKGWHDKVSRAVTERIGPHRDHRPLITNDLLIRVIRSYEQGVVFSCEEGIAKWHHMIDEPYPTVVILSGPPGCGKSTFRRTWKEAPFWKDAGVVSLDEIRDEFRQTRRKWNEGQVLQEALERFRVCLRENRNVFWDSTNLTREARSRLIQIAYGYKAYVNVVGFSVPLKECLKRNKQRGETVPEDAIKRMYERYQFPGDEEADMLLCVDPLGKSHKITWL